MSASGRLPRSDGAIAQPLDPAIAAAVGVGVVTPGGAAVGRRLLVGLRLRIPPGSPVVVGCGSASGVQVAVGVAVSNGVAVGGTGTLTRPSTPATASNPPAGSLADAVTTRTGRE